MDPDVELIAGIKLDDATMAALTSAISKAISKGFDSVRSNTATKVADQATKAFVAAAQKMRSANKEAGDSFVTVQSAAKKAGASLNGLQKEVAQYGQVVRDSVKDSATVIATSIQRTTVAQNRELERLADNERQAMRNSGKLQAIEAQRSAQSQIIAQRQAGEGRLAAARFMYESLGRLEKAFGATVSGVAKTMTSAVSRSLTGIGNLLNRSNSSMNAGLDSALNQRESSFRSSFRKQEQIVAASINRQQRQMTELRSFASTGVAGAITGRGIGAGILGLGIGVGVAQTLKTGYTDAVNFNEQLNKNRVVFGAYADQVINFFAKGAPQALGQTEAQVLESTGTFGNLFKNLGIGERDVFNFSTSLTALASDLASFNNTPVDEAITALRAGLTGESEPLKRFGIDVSDARLRHEAFLLGISDGKSVLDANTKAQAAYSVILKSAGDAQYDFARTAEQGANAARIRQASIAQLASTVGNYLVPVMTKANVVLGKFAVSASNFISGDLSGTLAVIRTGLIGVAAALGGVVAAKAGIEVFQFLRLSLGLLLTPMGAVIGAATLIGAGIAIMSQRSEEFRSGIAALGERLVDLGSTIADRLQPVFGRLGRFITDTVVPSVEGFAAYVSENLVDALDTAINFVTRTVIPGFRSLVSFLTATAAPLIASAVSTITSAFVAVGEAADAFFDRALPYLQPAIDGFTRLGDAIGSAFGGDFGSLGQGFGAAATGIGASAGKIGALILTVLKPVGATILTFLQGVFTKENIMALAGGFLDLVEEIGRIIGSIATDPRLIAALGAIVGAAAIIAFRFAKGLVEGILSNVPELLQGAGKILSLAFAKAIADPSILLKAVLAVILGTQILLPLINGFRSLGETSAGAFAAGLRSKITASSDYTRGLLGGGASSTGGAKGFFKQQIADVAGLQAQLRSLGSTMTVAMSPESIKTARGEIARLSEGMSEAQLKGLLMRDSLKQGFKAISDGASGVSRGLGQILGAFSLKGLVPASDAGSTGLFSGLKASAIDTFDTIRLRGMYAWDGMKSSASTAFGGVAEGLRTVGTVAKSQFDGVALRGLYMWDGFKSNAATAFGGVASGLQTVGRSATNAFQTIALKGMYAFDRVKQAVGDAISVTKDSRIAQVGAAYASQIAEGFRSGASTIRTAVSGALNGLRDVAAASGMKLGTFVASGMISALGGFIAGKAEGAAGGSGILSAVTSGLTAGLITGNVAIGAAAAGASLLGTAIGKSAKAAADAKKKVQSFADILNNALVSAAESGTAAVLTLNEALRGEAGVDVFAAVKTNLADVSGYLVEAGVSMGDVESAFRLGGSAVTDLVDKVRMGTDATDAQSAAAFRLAAEYNAVAGALGQVNNLRLFDPVTTGGRGVDDTYGQLEQSTRLATAAELDHSSAVEQYVRSRLAANAADQQAARDTALQSTLDAYRVKLDIAKVAADQFSQAIDNAFRDRSNASLQGSVDAAVLQMHDAFTDPMLLEGSLFSEAQLRTSLDSFTTLLSDTVKQGIEEGTIFDQASMNAKLLPILGSTLDGVKDDGLRQTITDAYTAGIENAGPLVQQRVFDDLAAGLAEPVTVTVEADVSSAKAAVGDLGVDLYGTGSTDGADYSRGLAAGIRGGTAGATAAARQIGSNVAAALRGILVIQSPSKVTEQIGEYVGEGLADGIDNSGALVSSAVGRLGRNLVKGIGTIVTDNPMRGRIIGSLADTVGEVAVVGLKIGNSIGQAIVDGLADKVSDIGGVARSAVDDALGALAFGGDKTKQGSNAAISQLFAGMLGSGSDVSPFRNSNAGWNLAGADLTDARNSFLSGFDSNVSTIFSVNQKKLAELNAIERQQYGQNIFSLQGQDYFGASNLKSITSVFDSIVEVGAQLISQGQPLDAVLATVKDQTSQFITLASNLGFNADELTRLAQSLGLSDEALAQFLSTVDEINAGLKNPPTPKDTKDAEDAEDTTTTVANEMLPRQITNYIVVPYGDPNAIALTVANQQAYDMRLP